MRKVALAVLASSLILAGCLASAPPPPQYTHADSYAAIDQAFADHGILVVARFHCIAQEESGHNPYAKNGQYDGILQLGDHYQGALEAAAVTLGRSPDWYDPYVNARAGRIIFDDRLRRGHDPFGPWTTAPGC